MRYTYILVLTSLSLLACGKKNKSESSGANAPIAGAGQLAFTIGEGVEPESVAGYIVGKQDELKVIAGSNGTFLIPNVPEGQHDIIVTGKSAGASQQESDRGIRLNEIVIGKEEKKDLAKIDLPKNSSIKGKVSLGTTAPTSLALKESLAGIDVYIPGTKYIVKSGEDGSFTMDSVPVGRHKLYIEKDGYRRGVFNIETKGGETFDAPNIALFVDTGEEGYVVVQDMEHLEGAWITNFVRTKKIRLSIGATSGSTLMKISACSDFRGKSWRPYAEQAEYTLEEECLEDLKGGYRIYIKFANGNGLESSPFMSDNYFLYNPASAKSLGIMNPRLRIHDIPTNAAKLFLSILDPSTGGFIEREEYPLQEFHDNFTKDLSCYYDGYSKKLTGDGTVILDGYGRADFYIEFADSSGQTIGKPIQAFVTSTCPTVQATIQGTTATIKLSGIPERATHMRKAINQDIDDSIPLEPASSADFSETAPAAASAKVVFYREGKEIGRIHVDRFFDKEI